MDELKVGKLPPSETKLLIFKHLRTQKQLLNPRLKDRLLQDAADSIDTRSPRLDWLEVRSQKAHIRLLLDREALFAHLPEVRSN